MTAALIKALGYGAEDYEIEIPIHDKELQEEEETSNSTNPSQSKQNLNNPYIIELPWCFISIRSGKFVR